MVGVAPFAIVRVRSVAGRSHRPDPLSAPLGFPRHAVMCWFGNIVRQRTVDIEPIHHVEFEHGDHPIFVIDHRGLPIALVSPGVGAPAAGASLEVVIALGATQIIGCGGAGVVKPGFDMGHVIVPTGAVRDEGTSYHRTPHDAEVTPHPWALAAIDDVLTEAGGPHDRGLVWTTDAIFRETQAEVAHRREQGCLAVEMEAAAMFACAAFRGATYAQLLYAGDDVSAAEWDHRNWNNDASARGRLLDLALDAVIRL
ncbi:MAG: nucleoside phosphorylase [Ilumatobacteraceae bacterium]|nr:nucleoside phosphorylase [Ilumatobacteraceae bacterium]